MAPDIRRECRHRAIPSGGLLIQRGQDNGVQIARQTGAQFIESGGAVGRNSRRLRIRRIQVRDRRTGPRRLLIGNGVHEGSRRASRRAIGGASHQQFVQQHAEGIDIAARVHGRAAGLLRAGIVRRHHRNDGQRGVLCRARDIEHLGNPEIQQLRFTVGSHQDVFRLDIAVHDMRFVGALHRGTDFLKQPQARFDGELVEIAILADGQAGDVLHHKVGQPLGGGAGVQYLGDIGMVECFENPPFVMKSPQHAVRIHAAFDQLDRQLFARIHVARAIHHPHAPLADTLQKLVASQTTAKVDV